MNNRIDLLETNIPEIADESLQWRSAFSDGLRSVDELLEYVKLDRIAVNLPSGDKLDYFPLRAPQSYVDKIEKGNPTDPLLLQILPSAQEFIAQPGYVKDPLAELTMNPVPGLIHKYANRVLLVTTKACTIHCRYCFRRHFPYDDNAMSTQNLIKALEYIEQNTDIEEVILSGGDPLSLSDAKLIELLRRIAGIEHVKRLRIHSRLIAITPTRATPDLLSAIMSLSKPLVMVMHVNHPNEIGQELQDACQRMRLAGIHLLNQTVLLRKVNDSSSTLKRLSLSLFDIGVLPYYLHLLDPVEGASHFDVSPEAAKSLMSDLQTMLSGYLMPKLVTERAGLQSKLNISFKTL